MHTAKTHAHETTNPATTGGPPAANPAPPTIEITSLSQIADLHHEPIVAKIFAYGRLLQFKGRRLLPSEADEIRNLLKQAIPPRTEKGEYDFDDGAYLARAHALKLQARAKTLWLAFDQLFPPQAAAAGAKAGDLAEITRFIQSLPMADEALETLFGVATAEPVSLVELTGFSSGSNSPTS